ncbi:hypothetical protein H0H87_011190 [Tephrocybe sp. NHM501043]|nr:hypothetical protein H0H87_011190 [Tephrocybe sp. NHM501043]
MTLPSLHPSRSFSRNHDLLPASRPSSKAGGYEPVPRIPAHSFITWTLGRGSVIWRIWPAVLLHTVFAGAVVTVSMRGIVHLDIPSIMLTVLGVVIGFVISYRASSGYDRYWLGRTCWSDVIRTSRTMGRLVWFHVPPRLTPKTQVEVESGTVERSAKEMMKVMNEKRMALDLVEGFAVALKHHIRGELGIYYEDLYHMVLPLHPHDHAAERTIETPTSALASPRRAQRISADPPLPHATSLNNDIQGRDPIIPPINAYGTFQPPRPHHQHHRLKRSQSQTSSLSSTTSVSSTSSINRRPLLPGALGPKDKPGFFTKVSSELIPFSGLATVLRSYFWPPIPRGNDIAESASLLIYAVSNVLVGPFGWYTIPGVAIAAFIYLGFLAAGEEIEQPFANQQTPRQGTMMYDFRAPINFFLADMTQNDLDLDLFCHDIVHADMGHLKGSPCLNAYFSPERPLPVRGQSMSVVDLSAHALGEEREGVSAEPSKHLEAFFALPSPSYEYFPWGPFSTPGEFHSILFQGRIQPNQSCVLFAIYDKTIVPETGVTVDGALAGVIGLTDASAANLSAEMAFVMISPKFQRTHVTSNAIGLLLHYCLDTPAEGGLGLRRMVWKASPLNSPSIKAAQRMGFTKEGILRWHWVLLNGKESGGNGKARREGDRDSSALGRDSVVLSLCWDDWESFGKADVDRVMARTF